MRLILDGTVVRVRLDRKATAISLLVVIGVRADGQKVLLAVRSMGGESAEAWRAVLDDLIKRGRKRVPAVLVLIIAVVCVTDTGLCRADCSDIVDVSDGHCHAPEFDLSAVRGRTGQYHAACLL